MVRGYFFKKKSDANMRAIQMPGGIKSSAIRFLKAQEIDQVVMVYFGFSLVLDLFVGFDALSYQPQSTSQPYAQQYQKSPV